MLPTVEDDAQFLPLPTLALELDLGDRWSLGVGLLAPYAALDGYPEDGGQRYSLVSFHGSVLATFEAAVAFKVTDDIFVGAGIQNMFVKLRSEVVFSACPKELTCAPEDPEFDAPGQIDATSWLTPSAVFGIQAQAAPWLRLGAAVQLPFFVSAGGTVKVRLPSSGFYNGAHVEGDAADVSLTLPPIVRVGAEVRPVPGVAIEAGVDWEAWSMQDELKVTPHDVRVEGAAGVGTYDFGPLAIPRRLKDTIALRLGVEAEAAPGLFLRAGFVHETGASPDEYLSVLTVGTEVRPIIDVTLGRFYASVNPIVAIDLAGDLAGHAQLEPAAKIAVRVAGTLSIGVESYSAFGPIDDLGAEKVERLLGAVDVTSPWVDVNFGAGYAWGGDDRVVVKVILGVHPPPG